MRLLLLVILMGFQLGSFARTDKSVVSGKQYLHIFSKKDVSVSNESSFPSKVTVHLIHFNCLKNISHCRQYPFAPFSNHTLTFKNAIEQEIDELLPTQDIYCKPIGLLLIFPKHYFW